jgi:hypothetical protein
MNDLPRHTLAQIIAEHGRAICAAPKRVEALLRDLCGAHRREINILIGALEERVATDLMAAGNSVPQEVLLARLAARLRDNLAYTPEAARWGVDSWAFALGIISEAELQTRALKESGEARRNDEPPPPPVRTPNPSAPNPASTGQQTPPTQTQQPRRGTTYAPTPSPQPQPKRSPQPSQPPQPIVRKPAPVPRRTPTIQPNVAVPAPPQPNVLPLPTARDTSRRGLSLRGCFLAVLLVIVLIVAAVFAVPIMLLKEEQAQPSINEPRIR